MNTQEVIELLNLQEIQAKQEVIKKYQVDKATIIRVHANDKYDLSNGMVNIQPLDTSKKFSVGDSVFLQIPAGDKQQTKIVARSNIKIPDEELYEYGKEPVEEGTIYLACSNENTIKVYSLAGAAGTDISPESNALYNIISSGDYLYCSSNSAYVAFMVKPDGTGYQEIVSQSRYYDARGLAINPAGTHLYIAYSTWEPSLGIAKINISTGEIEETELTDVSFDGISDLCGYGIYLYLLGYSGEISKIAVYDFDLNFVREISVSDIFEKITADGTNIYLSNSSKVDMYSLSGTFVRSISESGIRAVAVKNGKIYTVTQEQGGGAT